MKAGNLSAMLLRMDCSSRRQSCVNLRRQMFGKWRVEWKSGQTHNRAVSTHLFTTRIQSIFVCLCSVVRANMFHKSVWVKSLCLCEKHIACVCVWESLTGHRSHRVDSERLGCQMPLLPTDQPANQATAITTVTLWHQALPWSPRRSGQIKRTGRGGHVGGALFAVEQRPLSVQIKKAQWQAKGKPPPHHLRLPAWRKPIRLAITLWHGVTPFSGHSNTYYSSTKRRRPAKKEAWFGSLNSIHQHQLGPQVWQWAYWTNWAAAQNPQAACL